MMQQLHLLESVVHSTDLGLQDGGSTYITFQYIQWGAQSWIRERPLTLVFVWWNCFSISETQSGGIWHVSDYQLKIGWKCINVMSLEGAEGVYLSVNCDAFEDFLRTTKFDASQWKSLLLARQPTLATLIHLLTCTTSHLALVRENVNVGCVYVLQYDWWGMLSTRLFILAYG